MEPRAWSQLANLDVFFYYGSVDVEHATEHDIALGMIQPKRSLFYDRDDSTGISEYENLPNGFYQAIMMRYDIASWIARRNREVGDGQNGTEDRRVATSQTEIQIDQKGGEQNVRVRFIPFASLQEPVTLTIPIGG